jgi:effector-binding domain-containing protein
LRPARVDPESGYRFYEAHQLKRLNRILALKDLGFTLEQIAPLLAAKLSNEQLAEILATKKAEIERRLLDEQDTLARVEARLHLIREEKSMSQYEVVIKKVEPMRVAAIREVVPHYSEIGSRIGEVFAFLEKNRVRPAGTCGAVWHDNEYKESDVDGTAYVPIEQSARITGNDRVKVYDLAGVESMASLVHQGSYCHLSQAYQALLGWIEANGYTIVGENRELYLQGSNDGSQTDESCVTEIQFAVAKA